MRSSTADILGVEDKGEDEQLEVLTVAFSR